VTVADVLLMPAVRRADPVTLAGSDALHRPVRWVHATELPDIAGLLREGDLILTTGIALPDTDEELAGFASSLAESGAAALFIELGRRWLSVPAALVGACESAALPLVALRREVRFASVAQSVGERIVDQQIVELRESQQVHDTFTALSVAEAGPGEILAAVANLSAATTVLESDDRRVVDYAAGPGGATAFLDDWNRRSIAVRLQGRTEWDSSNGWLVARIGRGDRRWGRLIIDSPSRPSQRLVAIVERGTTALAMHMLHDRQSTSRERQLHHELLVAVLADPSTSDIQQRCRLAGLPTANRQFVAIALRDISTDVRPPVGGTDELLAATVHAAATRKVPALIAPVGGFVRALISVPRRAGAAKAADDIVNAIPARVSFLAAAGSVIADFTSADRTMREAHQVLNALPATAERGTVHHLIDTHVRGLLTMLNGDERLEAFSNRELSPLRAVDQAHQGRLEQALRAVLDHPSSKSAAAASLSVSRPVLYERLAQVERALRVDLNEGETRTSLHLAMLIADVSAPRSKSRRTEQPREPYGPPNTDISDAGR